MLLKHLSELRGISGQEKEVKSFINDEIEGHCDKIWTDHLGNLYARTNGRSDVDIGLFAHMDEVGFMVTGIDGHLLNFDAVGGINEEVMPGTVLEVGDERVPGVIGCPPIHLQKKEEAEKKIPIDDLRIDIGDVNDGIQIGDAATFDTRYKERRGLALGKAFDDRIGCYCLIEAIKADLDVSCTYVFTTQEEVGIRGSQVASNNLSCEYAIACEGTFSLDQPGVPKEDKVQAMGGGPVITITDRSVITDARLRGTIIKAAESCGMPYQLKRPFTGGTDAGMVHLSGMGVPSCVISTSCKFIHSPCAMASLEDIKNSRRLLIESILSVSGGL
ncbi:MAG: M42 family metallopeptidase [Candidatus Methanofastidiosa archaeon]|nr:M42 family metallopeptidase [Candidatus Methanofastidiosa archaeon]